MPKTVVGQIDKHIVPKVDSIEHVSTPHCWCQPESHKTELGWVYLHAPYTDAEVQYDTIQVEAE